jgi:hypothetical protein
VPAAGRELVASPGSTLVSHSASALPTRSECSKSSTRQSLSPRAVCAPSDPRGRHRRATPLGSTHSACLQQEGSSSPRLVQLWSLIQLRPCRPEASALNISTPCLDRARGSLNSADEGACRVKRCESESKREGGERQRARNTRPLPETASDSSSSEEGEKVAGLAHRVLLLDRARGSLNSADEGACRVKRCESESKREGGERQSVGHEKGARRLAWFNFGLSFSFGPADPKRVL